MDVSMDDQNETDGSVGNVLERRAGERRIEVKKNDPPKVHYDCSKCPAYCCSYKRISISEKDINRIAKHFGIDADTALRRFTKVVEGEQVLRHQKDAIYGTICMFLDTKTRRCTIYQARPGVCHEYPERSRCGYYEFLRWERRHQGDPDFVPLT
jgi:Fe-S-cluster containining protein